VFRLVHGDDWAAEPFRAQDVSLADDAKFPVLGTRILEQETRRAIRELPQSSKRNFTHALGTLFARRA